MESLFEWVDAHQNVIVWVGAASALTVVVSVVTILFLVARIPQDYFLRRQEGSKGWRFGHPAVHVTFVISKNVAGALLVLAGVLLSLPLVPGQGILTILIGLGLLDFPGKRKLELKLVRQKHVLNGLNWIRARAGREPFQVSHEGDDVGGM